MARDADAFDPYLLSELGDNVELAEYWENRAGKETRMVRIAEDAGEAQARGHREDYQAGAQTADYIINAQSEAGMPPGDIAAKAQETSGFMFSEARTKPGQAFAIGFDDTVVAFARSLDERELAG